MFCLQLCMCTTFDSLELELQRAVSQYENAGNLTQVPLEEQIVLLPMSHHSSLDF